MEDKEYNIVKNYLSSGVYPEFVDNLKEQEDRNEEKRKIRSKSVHYTLGNGYLLCKKTSTIVPMKTDLERILKECHDNAFSGGHFVYCFE